MQETISMHLSFLLVLLVSETPPPHKVAPVSINSFIRETLGIQLLCNELKWSGDFRQNR